MPRLFNILLLTVFFLMTACKAEKDKEAPRPATVLDEEALAELMTDFAMAESAANLNAKGVDINRLDSVYAFNPLKERGLRKSQYDSTISWYIAHPTQYKKVYERVIEKLSELEAKR
jgi:hypothetical protein